MRVLLLEAGGDPLQQPTPAGLPEDYDVPAFHPLASENPAMRWDFFVRHYADDAQQRRDPQVPRRKGVLYPRAGTLGGCTAHNAMIFVRAARQRLGRHRRTDRRPVLARRRDAALLAAAGELPLSPAVAPPRPIRHRSDRTRLGRLARQRMRAAARGDARRRSGAAGARLGARRRPVGRATRCAACAR